MFIYSLNILYFIGYNNNKKESSCFTQLRKKCGVNMSENRQNRLLSERDRLVKAWLTAEHTNKMSILVRIEDIDEQLRSLGSTPVKREVLPRRFIRR